MTLSRNRPRWTSRHRRAQVRRWLQELRRARRYLRWDVDIGRMARLIVGVAERGAAEERAGRLSVRQRTGRARLGNKNARLEAEGYG